MLSVNRRIAIPLSEFRFAYSRSGGPGGQNVNKVNTRVTLRWDVAGSPSLPDDVRERFASRFKRRLTRGGELVLHCQRFRDQRRNVDECLSKLKAMLLEVAVAPRRRKPTRPTRTSVEKRIEQKRQTSQKKQRRRTPAPGE